MLHTEKDDSTISPVAHLGLAASARPYRRRSARGCPTQQQGAALVAGSHATHNPAGSRTNSTSSQEAEQIEHIADHHHDLHFSRREGWLQCARLCDRRRGSNGCTDELRSCCCTSKLERAHLQLGAERLEGCVTRAFMSLHACCCLAEGRCLHAARPHQTSTCRSSRRSSTARA